MSRAPLVLTADLQYPSLQALLRFLVTSRHPYHEDAHCRSQLPHLPGVLTRAQRRPLDLSRAHFHDDQTGTETLPWRHGFSRPQHQRARCLRRPQPPVPTQPMASLRVSHGAEQPFRQAL